MPLARFLKSVERTVSVEPMPITNVAEPVPTEKLSTTLPDATVRLIAKSEMFRVVSFSKFMSL